MPPSSSPPPARPGPPCTRCGTGEPCPVLVRATLPSSTRTRPWNGRDAAEQRRDGGRVGAGDRGDERAAAAVREPHGIRHVVVADHRRDRAERLDLVHGVGIGVVEAQQNRRDEGAVGRRTDGAVGVRHERARPACPRPTCAAAGEQRVDALLHLVALVEAGERAHRDALGARVAEHHALLDARADGLGDGIHPLARHDHAADARALLAGLRRHLGDDGCDVRVELGRARHGIRAEDRGVERVGLAGEVARRLRAHCGCAGERARGRRRAGEADLVAHVEVVEEAAHRAADQLQRSLGQQAGVEHRAHAGLGRRRRSGVAGLTMLGTPARKAGANFSSMPQTGKLKALTWKATPGTRV